MTKPLLTIAIPTWNRAEILKDSLAALLPQIAKHKDRIEIVLSDNASTDQTNDVIKACMVKYDFLNIIHFQQNENSGYFGNFKKCRELSNGSYFWLLSDNDHLANGIVEFVLSILEKKSPSFVFLSDWKHSKTINETSVFEYKEHTVNEAIELFNYKITLISAVIFLNNKDQDSKLFEDFQGNTFIGFMYFLQSLDYKRSAIGIKGTSLFIKDTAVSFNAFKSFAVDLMVCINYAVVKHKLPVAVSNTIINKVISELTVKHYILFRITGKLHGMNPGSKMQVDAMLFKGFNGYKAYQQELKPLIDSTTISFYRMVLMKHLIRLLKNRINNNN